MLVNSRLVRRFNAPKGTIRPATDPIFQPLQVISVRQVSQNACIGLVVSR
jgi:hypothetical protein